MATSPLRSGFSQGESSERASLSAAVQRKTGLGEGLLITGHQPTIFSG